MNEPEETGEQEGLLAYLDTAVIMQLWHAAKIRQLHAPTAAAPLAHDNPEPSRVRLPPARTGPRVHPQADPGIRPTRTRLDRRPSARHARRRTPPAKIDEILTRAERAHRTP
jgi:hypothetical protein